MFFAGARLIKSAQFYQQQGYEAGGFIRFVFKGLRLVDKRLSLCVFIYAVAASGGLYPVLDIFALSVFFIIAGIAHKNPFKHSREKKKFVMTMRVWRMWGVAQALNAFMFIVWIRAAFGAAVGYSLANYVGYLLLIIIMQPVLLVFADMLLMPVQWLVNLRYTREAERKLRALNPIIIGITGSYGKTSTKNILQHILAALSTSVATKRSINTRLGLVRFIREEVDASHKFVIAEIGAGKPGDISAISRLIGQKHAILTAVGDMHYAYFKTRDAVAAEKFAIFTPVKAQGGEFIVNALQVAGEYSDKYVGDYAAVSFLSPESISDVSVDAAGVHFVLDGERIDAPIYGKYMAYNIALAVMMARKLGFALSDILRALATLPQTSKRQEVVREAGKPIVILDNYNSNPDGFISAMETARAIAGAGRVILVSPGMLELGDKHAEYHRRVAVAAVQNVDVLVAVVPDRIRDLTDEFARLKRDGQELVEAENSLAAQEWVAANATPSDVVLYENDIADIYEEKISI